MLIGMARGGLLVSGLIWIIRQGQQVSQKTRRCLVVLAGAIRFLGLLCICIDFVILGFGGRFLCSSHGV